MELLCRARADDCLIYANAPRKSQSRIRGRIMGSECAVRSGCCSGRENIVSCGGKMAGKRHGVQTRVRERVEVGR